MPASRHRRSACLAMRSKGRFSSGLANRFTPAETIVSGGIRTPARSVLRSSLASRSIPGCRAARGQTSEHPDVLGVRRCHGHAS